jgi:outer membrane protein OmpA-like peptidoglycan-associated protein
MRHSKEIFDDDDDGFGPGTDLIISLLAVLLISIALGANIYQKQIDSAKTKNKGLEEEIAAANRRLEWAQGRVKAYKKAETPIINIPATSRYQFESRSALLPASLGAALSNELAPQINSIVREYQVDVVEVIGHTDGQSIGQGASNLDLNLEKVAGSSQAITTLVPGSNADLGLMRALSVIQVLQKNKKLKGLKFRAYSAAQLTLPGGEFASDANKGSDPSRRRIEIRFTRLGVVKNID